jgi:hypothetical protein
MLTDRAMEKVVIVREARELTRRALKVERALGPRRAKKRKTGHVVN